MERKQQGSSQDPMTTGPVDDARTTSAEQALEEPATPSAFQAFRSLLDKARRTQQPISTRRELSRDKSKSLFLLVAVCVVLLLIFFGVFSSPKARTPLPGETARGAPSP